MKPSHACQKINDTCVKDWELREGPLHCCSRVRACPPLLFRSRASRAVPKPPVLPWRPWSSACSRVSSRTPRSVCSPSSRVRRARAHPDAAPGRPLPRSRHRSDADRNQHHPTPRRARPKGRPGRHDEAQRRLRGCPGLGAVLASSEPRRMEERNSGRDGQRTHGDRRGKRTKGEDGTRVAQCVHGVCTVRVVRWRGRRRATHVFCSSPADAAGAGV